MTHTNDGSHNRGINGTDRTYGNVDEFINEVNGTGTLNDEQRARYNRSFATLKAGLPAGEQEAAEAKVRAVLKP